MFNFDNRRDENTVPHDAPVFQDNSAKCDTTATPSLQSMMSQSLEIFMSVCMLPKAQVNSMTGSLL